MKHEPCSYCGMTYHQPYDDGLVECRARVAERLGDVEAERDQLRAEVATMREEAAGMRRDHGEQVDELLEQRSVARIERDKARLAVASLRDALALAIELVARHGYRSDAKDLEKRLRATDGVPRAEDPCTAHANPNQEDPE